MLGGSLKKPIKGNTLKSRFKPNRPVILLFNEGGVESNITDHHRGRRDLESAQNSIVMNLWYLLFYMNIRIFKAILNCSGFNYRLCWNWKVRTELAIEFKLCNKGNHHQKNKPNLIYGLNMEAGVRSYGKYVRWGLQWYKQYLITWCSGSVGTFPTIEDNVAIWRFILNLCISFLNLHSNIQLARNLIEHFWECGWQVMVGLVLKVSCYASVWSLLQSFDFYQAEKILNFEKLLSIISQVWFTSWKHCLE